MKKLITSSATVRASDSPQKTSLLLHVKSLERRILELEKRIGVRGQTMEPNIFVTTRQIEIKKAAAKFFGIDPVTLEVKSNSPQYTLPRHVTMYLMYVDGMSYPTIGKAFGGMNHTTAQHAVQKIHQQRQYDTKLDRALKEISAQLSDKTEDEMQAAD